MTIQVVGIGLNGVSGLGESVRKIVDEATVLVGSDRHLRYFPNHTAFRIKLRDLTETLVEIQQYLLSFETNTPDLDPVIVVLVSGDPLFFGLGRLLLTKFPPEYLTFHPHVSSIQLAFNRVKVPWQDAKIISTHGRSFEQLTQALQQGAEKIAILTDPTHHTPKAIANLLSSLDLAIFYQFWVCENLGGTEERVQQWLVEDISTQEFSSLNVVILLRESSISPSLDLSQVPFLGIPDTLFCSFSDRPGLMTKREVRTLVLGELGLQPEQIIWDIGAGTGSVSIETARLFPNSTIYAVEKTAAGTALIEQNRERFQTPNVISIHGEAPAMLHRLRAPHRIFIGGSGGKLEEILGLCSVRLISGGIIVLAMATLEHLNLALEWIQERIKIEPIWHYQLLQVQLSRSVPVSNLTRFSPLNPVTIITIYHVPKT